MKKLLIYMVIVFGIASLLLLPAWSAPFDIEPDDVTNKDVEDSLMITRYTEFCGGWTECVFCMVSNDTVLNYELKEADVSAKLIDYTSKDELVISYDSKTAKEQEVYIRVEYTKTPAGLETCYYHTRTEQTKNLVLDIIPIVLGFHQEKWATWSPSSAEITAPLNATYVSGTTYINATISDSNLNQVFYQMEWTNGSSITGWNEMIGHDEIWTTVFPYTDLAKGQNDSNGRWIYYTEYENVVPDYTNILRGRSVNDDKWGGDAIVGDTAQYGVPDAYGGNALKCFRGNLENCTDTAEVTYVGVSPVCDLYLWSATTNEMRDINVSYDDVNWVNNTGWVGDDSWYQAFDDAAGVARADGRYNYTVYFRRIDIKFYDVFSGTHTQVNGIKCVPQTALTQDRTSFYQTLDTTAYADGLYRFRLNMTNTTWHDNTTYFNDATIDSGVPETCTLIYPPDFDDVCGDSSQCGYTDLNPVVNVSASDAGSGIAGVNITWTGTAATLGNFTTVLEGSYYINDSTLVNDEYTVCAFCIDNAGKINSSCTTATVKWYSLDPSQNETLYDLENCDTDYINTTVDQIWNYILQNYNTLNATQSSVTSVTVASESGYVNTTYFNVHENHIFAGEEPELDGSMWKYDQMKHNIYIDVPANITSAEACGRMRLIGSPTDTQYTVILNNKTLGTGTATNTSWHWDCIELDPANITTSMEFIYISNASWNVVNHYVWGVDQHGAFGYSHTSTDDGATWDEYPDGEFVMYLRVENYVVGLGETVWTYDNRTLTEDMNITNQDIDIILGIFFFALLCFVAGFVIWFTSGRDEILSFVSKMLLLFFVGIGIFSMSLGTTAIFTGWNNTLLWNQTGTNIPDTVVTLSIWSIWIFGLLVALGLILWLIKWYGDLKT